MCHGAGSRPQQRPLCPVQNETLLAIYVLHGARSYIVADSRLFRCLCMIGGHDHWVGWRDKSRSIEPICDTFKFINANSQQSKSMSSCVFSLIFVADRGGAIGASRWWWLTAACHPRLTRLTARWSGSTWQASKPSYAIIISSSVNTWGKFGAIVLALGRGGRCVLCLYMIGVVIGGHPTGNR